MMLDRYWRAVSIFSEVSVCTFEFRIDFSSVLANLNQFILRLIMILLGFGFALGVAEPHRRNFKKKTEGA